MKKWFLAMGLGATMVVIAACDVSDVEQVETEQEEAEASEESAVEEGGGEEEEVVEESISIGDTMNFDGLQITLNDAYTSAGSDWETPENDHYVILDLTIENTTDEAANISTMMQMSLQDGEGYTHNSTIYTETTGSLDGEIGPGRDNRGEVPFDVNASDEYEFIFENPFTSGQAIWTITDL
ncbi:hypothetical protein JCM19037_2298 [Geomicrobium sp. JCM 19037]|uniref:DUF4352 domain-containing protein n=1 Tax=unclassified Geomicrobium TaxID=2628951 RepID=UPI00045F1A27|nr:DUF4352 domain-containing protein [Geomicrobium sp. JCM 19037]GAK03937.1 hypothetical protein JCM19037_2298 [Geomicrobium sp. JCM 19037]